MNTPTQLNPKEQLLAALAGWLDSVTREGSPDQAITFEKVGFHKDVNGQPAGPIIMARVEVSVAAAKLEFAHIVQPSPGIILPTSKQ